MRCSLRKSKGGELGDGEDSWTARPGVGETNYTPIPRYVWNCDNVHHGSDLEEATRETKREIVVAFPGKRRVFGDQ